MAYVQLPAYRRGFTLIEMLIVILVIAIMALIVIPRLQGAVRKAREATFRANLQQLRTALATFETDTGLYPVGLRDLVAPPTTGTDAGDTVVLPGTYKGPYLTQNGGVEGIGIPVNPFGPSGASATVETHWGYTSATGQVYSGVDGTSMDGEPLTNL